MLAIIGGSGLTRLSTLAVAHREVVRTPYGEPRRRWCSARSRGATSFFWPATGTATRFRRTGSTIAPICGRCRRAGWQRDPGGRLGRRHRAPIRASGDLVLPHQLIDYTQRHGSTRSSTAATGKSCTSISRIPTPSRCASDCRAARAPQAYRVHDGGVYGAVSGPRLETAAEIDRLERDGATLVGMTGMPEAVLARELGLAYAAICVVVNHAAGRGDSAMAISMESIAAVLETAMDKVALADRRRR